LEYGKTEKENTKLKLKVLSGILPSTRQDSHFGRRRAASCERIATDPAFRERENGAEFGEQTGRRKVLRTVNFAR
jgi:hypothetical protein